MKTIILLSLGLVAVTAVVTVALPAPAIAAPQTGTVVLELFTSQGCSSCPPADRAVAEVAGQPGVIVISRPVMYWDALGWKDTFGRPENTELQRAYQKRLKTRSVYTPQLVADGVHEWVGSNRGRLASEIKYRSDTVKVAIAKDSQNTTIALSGPKSGPAEVKLLTLRSAPKVAIGRGENGGQTVTYTNVVASEAVIGTWRGGVQRLRIANAKLGMLAGDRMAIIVQSPGAGAIHGAALTDL